MRRAERGSSRALPRGLVGVVLLLLAARVAGALYESSHPSVPTSLVNWVPLEQAEALSRERRLPIFYEFGAEWCEPCKDLNAEVFNDDETAREINATYIPVRVVDARQDEGSNSPEVAELVSRFRVEVLPTLLIVTPEGKVVKTRFGYGGITETRLFFGFATAKTM